MDAQSAERKAAVASFYDAVSSGHIDAIGGLIASSYVPHVAVFREAQLNPGGEALVERLQRQRRIGSEVKRMIADGDLVFAHVKYAGKVPVAGVDIFRFDAAGKIAEHWNIRQPLPQDSARLEERFATLGRAAMRPWEPERLKNRVRQMLSELWGKGNAALVPDFYDESYVQHNLDMPGGFRRIQEIVANEIQRYISVTGGPFPVNVHRIGAEGDLVFVHISIFMAGINRNEGVRSTNVDIFRVDENGRMVEHWDVLEMASEPLPDESTLF
ncbi:MAG: nuclear transport factor 2 family protein [Steroidobacteraceae bacterium]